MARPISAKTRYILQQMRDKAKEQEGKGTIPHILAVVRAKRAARAYQVQA